MRIACLLIPNLPLCAELRARPDLLGKPIAIATGPDARAEILACSPEAAALGLRPPCSVSHARSLSSQLIVRVASPVLERTTRDALLDVALSLSPRAALAPRSPGIFICEAAVFLDATGVDSLYRSEAGFAAALAARAERAGLPGSIAIASSRSIAKIVARKLAVPNLARAAFGASDELQNVARAEGREVETPLPEPRDASLREAIDLDYPIQLLEPLAFVLRGMLSRLTERLTLRGLASGPIDLSLNLCEGGRDHRRIGIAAPTRDPRVLLRLVVQTLEATPPEAPIEGIALSTLGICPRRDQLDLFITPGPDPAETDRTLAELESLCGPGQVGSPAVLNDNHPCAFELKPFSSDTSAAPKSSQPSSTLGPKSAGDVGLGGSPLVVRALRPPVHAEVKLHHGHPSNIRSAVACGHIVNVAGPWRTTGRWWSQEGRFALDHFDVQVSDGTILRLCFDWTQRNWQVDAIYD